MDKDIYDRMERFIRKAANRAASCEEADEIVKLIDPPVDPDLLAARQIAVESMPQHAQKFAGGALLEGMWDQAESVKAALAGIKFGRAHALSDLAKLPDDFARAKVLAERSHTSRIDDITDGIAYGRAQLEPQRTVPPIEQDLIDAREIVAQIVENNSLGDKSALAENFRKGGGDGFPSVQLVVNHLRDRREP